VVAVRRRELLGSVVAGTTAAAAGCTAIVRSLTGDRERDADAVTVETIDAPGSSAGTTTVPAPGRVTFVEFFATTCPICASQMPVVGDAYGRLDDGVQFLSVTSEPVGLTVSTDDVRTWWVDQGGRWPVGVDDGVTLAKRYDATSVPTAVVLDTAGRVTWRHTGRTTTDRIVAEVEAVKDGGEP
jgi:thiol-disulfide isomerase/thioredoxin